MRLVGQRRLAMGLAEFGHGDTDRYWRLVEAFRPTSLSAVPTVLAALANVPLAGADISSISYCRTGADDRGLHTVCTVMTDEFLEFSALRGNDLSTPVPEFDFPGLVEGDRWCLCVTRWQEALEAGCAPQVVLEATHLSALEFVSLEDLRAHAVEA